MPDIIIIGAGPAGLAVAYHLQKQNLPFLILEKEHVGFAWANHYDSLSLHTLKQVSGLPGRPMPDHYPDFPDKDQVLAYFRDYANHFGFPLEENTAVSHAQHDGTQWQIQTNRGTNYQATQLIIATGIWSTPFCPTFEGQERFNGRFLHSNDYQNPKPFQGKRVLVIGTGNSGCEIAAELGNAGVETAVSVQIGAAFVPHPSSPTVVKAATWLIEHLPQSLSNAVLSQLRTDFSDIGLPMPPTPPTQTYPVVGFALPEAVKAGKVTVYDDIDKFTETGACFVDGETADFDTIILATGYKPTVGFLEPTPELDENGRLLHPERFPNLHPAGFRYPATSGWLQVIGRVAEQTVRQLTQAHQAMG